MTHQAPPEPVLVPGDYCFTIIEGQTGPGGYIPSIVVRDDAGHYPLMGNGPFAAPWYWGRTYITAVQHCADQNAELGLTPDQVYDIKLSSLAASIRESANG